MVKHTQTICRLAAEVSVFDRFGGLKIVSCFRKKFHHRCLTVPQIKSPVKLRTPENRGDRMIEL